MEKAKSRQEKEKEAVQWFLKLMHEAVNYISSEFIPDEEAREAIAAFVTISATEVCRLDMQTQRLARGQEAIVEKYDLPYGPPVSAEDMTEKIAEGYLAAGAFLMRKALVGCESMYYLVEETQNADPQE